MFFFDSHSHRENGLASSDCTSILMLFYCLEDLIAYLYAFYESMRIDLNVQFDFLPTSNKNFLLFTRNSQRHFLKPTFMIKLCDKNRKLLLQKIPNQL